MSFDVLGLVSLLFMNLHFFISVQKNVETSEEKKSMPAKKKLKELRILDSKTAQNLCM